MPSEEPLETVAQIAHEAYLFAYPLMLMETTRRAQTETEPGTSLGAGPPNRFTHSRAFPPGDFRVVVRPNFDTLYSILWFDLDTGPLMIDVPDAGERYYMLPFLDMWSEVFAVIGSRTTGNRAGRYALTTPDWDGHVPAGVGRIESPTRAGWVIGRVQTNGARDYPAVHDFQDQLVATPFNRAAAPDSPTPQPDPTATGTGVDPLDLVSGMSGVEVLSSLADLMARYPAHLVDQPMLARLRRLGIEPGQTLDAERLDPNVISAIDTAAGDAIARMATGQTSMGPMVNGWMTPTSAMGTYGTDYLRRAIIAKVGLGANLVEDAVYPLLAFDAEGDAPRGEVDYVLHFDADKLPPIDAFWSVTMYDADGFTVPNSQERYALGDRDALEYNDDGSLDLWIQHDDPGEGRRSNWLPSPRGPIGVTMRLYGPRPAALDGSWAPPPLQRA